MTATRPNFIVMLTDDQGYGDLSCTGAKDFRTPHLDAVAQRGVRFTHWYANGAVCSPTRASLLSGRYPGHAGVRSIVRGHRTATGMPADRVTSLAAALKPLGYRTGLFGKWHLGLAPGCRPNDHGFDEFVGHLAGCIDYYSHIFYWDRSIDPLHDLWHNDREIWADGHYFTELITDHAVRFIDDAAEARQPFMIYLAFNAPHYPMHAPQRYMQRFADLPWPRQVMAAMLAAVDDAVGRVVGQLQRHGLLEQTCITFQSDNGPSRETRNWLNGTREPYYGGDAGPFRGHKFSLFEGGIRVPGLLSYPARVPAGRVLDTPAASMDIFPTLLAAAGGDPAAYDLDGVNLLPHLADAAPAPDRDLFFEQGHQQAIRRGRFKLIRRPQEVETQGPVAELFLSDLFDDPGERTNHAADHPRIAAELSAALDDWHGQLQQRYERQFGEASAGTT